jgi:Mg-chelatase subunit ChlD
MKSRMLKVVQLLLILGAMFLAGMAFSVTPAPLQASEARDPQDLNPPTNLACLPFPQPSITEYNGEEIEDVYTTEATQTTITWRDESDSETAYRVQRRVPDGDWVEIASLPADSMIYTDTGLPEVGGNYFYRVGAQEGDTTMWRESCRKPMFLDSDEGNFRVFYRPFDDPQSECPDIETLEDGILGMCSSEDTAQRMADTLEASYDWLMTEWIPGNSFPDPLHNGPTAVDLTLCNGSGCARTDDFDNRFIALRPASMALILDHDANTGEAPLRVPRHELFHHAQQGLSYGGDVKWMMEGTARSTDDKYCLDAPTCDLTLDHYVGGRYLADVGQFLASPNRTLFETDYNAALFWTYISEQYGTLTDEPERGVDFFVQMWESGNNHNHSHGREVIDFTLDDMGYSETFEDVFKDFVVANYAKDIPNAPDKYKYADEAQSTGSYGSVFLTDDQTLSPGEQYIVDENVAYVEAWGARYFRFNFFPGVPTLDVKAQSATGDILYYTLLAVKNGSIVNEINVTGATFEETIPNDDLGEVVLVIAGLEERSNFSLAVNATQPELRIQDPIAGRPAQGGDPNTPEKILVKVSVLSPEDGNPIAGIDPENFTVTVGSNTVDPDEVISSAYIQGEYWLLLRAPTQTATGSYALTVSNDTVAAGTTISDIEANAVLYNGAIESDNIVVADRSGSMNDFPGKLEAAQEAARLYVDSWESGDQFGLVSYNNQAVVNPTLQSWTTDLRDDAFTVIENWTAFGGTGIGNALEEALAEFDATGDEDHPWHIFLLSDGMETETPTIEDFIVEYDARVADGEDVPTIHAVALGPDADQQAMQKLANATNGTYEYAGEGLAQFGGDAGIELSHELAEIYRVVAETIALEQQIYSARDTLPYGPQVHEHDIHVDASVSEAVFVVKSAEGSLGADLRLVRPDGVNVPLTRGDARHTLWRVPSPMEGTWTVRVFYTPPGVTDGTTFAPEGDYQFDYLVEAAVRSDLIMKAFLGLAPEERYIGRPMPILVSLSDSQPLTGATVTGIVTNPAGTEYPVTYHDDGLHGDGSAGDGFYGTTFYFTSQPGSYQVVIDAEGTSPLHGDYVRRARLSFYLDRGTDTDQDGLPDHWEDDNGLDPERPNPSNSDDDMDGLLTFLEFQIGTHPLDSDTDNGGESDGSEYQRGASPQANPMDDAVRPVMVTGWAGSERVWLTFNDPGPGGHVKVFRGNDINGPFVQVGQTNPGIKVYIDVVYNHTEYCYRVVTVNADLRESGSDETTCVTPKEDPIAPQGQFVINQDAGTTSDDDVILSLESSDAPSDDHIESDQIPPVDERTVISGVSHVMVSNFPDFTGGVWVPTGGNIEFEWKVEEGESRERDPNGAYLATVYVKFRDAAGNESHIAQDSIWVDMASGGGFKTYLPLIRK